MLETDHLKRDRIVGIPAIAVCSRPVVPATHSKRDALIAQGFAWRLDEAWFAVAHPRGALEGFVTFMGFTFQYGGALSARMPIFQCLMVLVGEPNRVIFEAYFGPAAAAANCNSGCREHLRRTVSFLTSASFLEPSGDCDIQCCPHIGCSVIARGEPSWTNDLAPPAKSAVPNRNLSRRARNKRGLNLVTFTSLFGYHGKLMNKPGGVQSFFLRSLG